MANSLAVRFQREVVDEPKQRSAEMPVATPMMGGLHPGGKETPLPGRRRAGPKDLPWRSWLQNKRPGIKRHKRKSIAQLMG